MVMPEILTRSASLGFSFLKRVVGVLVVLLSWVVLYVSTIESYACLAINQKVYNSLDFMSLCSKEFLLLVEIQVE